MHHNVSMFDAHRIPPLFPEVPSVHLGLPQEERSLTMVLFMAKVLSYLRGRPDGTPKAPAGLDDRGSMNEGAPC